MGLLDDLFGNKEKSTGKNSSDFYRSGSSSGRSNQQGNRNSLSSTIENLIRGGTRTTGTNASAATIENLLFSLPLFIDQFNSSNSSEQADAASQAAINQVLNAGIPGISSTITASGGYDSTTRGILRDNLVAQAADAGAQTRLEHISRSNDQSIQALQQLLGVVGLAQSQNIVDEESSTGSSNQGTSESEHQVIDTSESREEGGHEEGIGSQTTRARDSIWDIGNDVVGTLFKKKTP